MCGAAEPMMGSLWAFQRRGLSMVARLTVDEYSLGLHIVAKMVCKAHSLSIYIGCYANNLSIKIEAEESDNE